MFFGRLRIQTKLALLVLVPLLGVVGLAVPIVLSRVDAATQAQRTADSVALADRVGSMLQELQQERLLSVGYLLGVVDRARLELQSAEAVDWVTGLAEERRGAVPVSLLGPLSSARALDTTRAAVLDRKLRADQVINEYATVIIPIIDAIGLRRQADLTTSTGRQVLALDSVLRADEGISQTMSLLAVAVASDNPSQIITVSQRYTVLQAEADRFRNFGTPEQVLLYEDVQKSFTARAGNNFLETLTLDPAVAGRTLSVPTLFPSVESVSALGRFIEKKITADVTAAAAESRSRATTTAYVVVALTLLLVVLVVALSLAVAQAVARPLRRLTTSADRIARTAEDELQRVADDEAEATRPVRLDSVDVQARDEIGDLARAFERVQGTAARLVERQVASRRNVAQMFGHVGRRTQNLVGRQLALIDRLERQETDSSRLRELYRLDHVSSRLRRNASSLVVLSGGTGADDYMEPMPLGDVVRLALGEIEDYPRVDVDVPDDAIVVPALVGDLTLLLAELMENATSFSPPHTRVTVTATAAERGMRLTVVDHGLGLTDDRLEEENARLTRRERLDLVPTEVLGLFVVGRLARRHGMTVALHATPGGGVSAVVELQESHLLPTRSEPVAAAGVPIGGPAGRAALPAVPTSPGVVGPAGPGVPTGSPFDPAPLTRASRTLAAARSWNAFLPRREGAGNRSRPAAPGTAAPGTAAPAAFDNLAGDPPAPTRRPPTTDGPATASRPAPGGQPATGDGFAAAAGNWLAGPTRPPAQALPASSATPVSPATPATPVSPATPVNPATPATLVSPATPATPVSPATPVNPAAPATPVNPATPATPVNPATPAAYATPISPARLPRPRDGGNMPALRRRVPGSQLPEDCGAQVLSPPSAPADADAARTLVEQFEEGVHRAQREVVRIPQPGEPAAATPAPQLLRSGLTRRVPGATLPATTPPARTVDRRPTEPMDPDEARNLIEQFESGVALALRDARPQPGGQQR